MSLLKSFIFYRNLNFIILDIKGDKFMFKDSHIFNFNCSKSKLINQLDRLNVENVSNYNKTNLLCERINSKAKFMLYTNITPGTYSHNKSILDVFTFEGEILGDESNSYILGNFKSSWYIKLFTILGFIFTLNLAIKPILNGFIIVHIFFLPVILVTYMLFIKNKIEKILLFKVNEFRKTLNCK